MMIEAVNTNDTLTCVDNPSYFDTRHAAFALNHAKQLKNLRKDAVIEDFDIVINNHEENVNIKCSSGFYLEVASPGLLSLANQTAGSSIVIQNLKIKCCNSKNSLDTANLLINSTYFFDLADNSGHLLGRVTVHCHVTTKVVQLQGSKLVNGMKAPVWFLNNVLMNTFLRESSVRSDKINQINQDILRTDSAEIPCKLCDKTYKTATGLQRHIQTKHEQVTRQSDTADNRILRKRRIPVDSQEYSPPAKALALDISPVTPPVKLSLSSSCSSLSSTSTLTTVTASVRSTAIPSVLCHTLNNEALPFIPIVPPSLSPPSVTPPIPLSAPPPIPSPPPISYSTTESPTISSSFSLSPVTSSLPILQQPVVALPGTEPATALKSKQNKKNKKTLALTPEEFERENLKVERDTCRLELAKLATEKKDLADTLEILTTRCRLLEDERNKAATLKVAPKAIPAENSSPSPSPSVGAGTSPLETLINLEVLKAVKTISPDQSTHVPSPPPSAVFATNDLVKEIDDNVKCIIENQKFLFERFQELLKTVNMMAQSPVQTLRGSTSTDACTQTSPVSSTPSSVPLMATLAPRPTRSPPPPPPPPVPTQTRRPLHGVSPAPGPITYPPPPFSYQPLPSTFSSDRREPKPPAEPSVR